MILICHVSTRRVLFRSGQPGGTGFQPVKFGVTPNFARKTNSRTFDTQSAE
jgi:hypothetical protein